VPAGLQAGSVGGPGRAHSNAPAPPRTRARCPAGARPITAPHRHHRRIATSATATLTSSTATATTLPSQPRGAADARRPSAAVRISAARAPRPRAQPLTLRPCSPAPPLPRLSNIPRRRARPTCAARRGDPPTAAHFPSANEPCRRRAGQRARTCEGRGAPPPGHWPLPALGLPRRSRPSSSSDLRPPPAVPSASQTPSPPSAAASLAAPRALPASACPTPNPSLTYPALPAAAPRCTGNPFGNASGMSAPALLAGVNPFSG
jgi:hypothetical protein